MSIRYGTAAGDLNAAPAIFATPIRALAEGKALRRTARSVQVDQDTACDWRDRAAQPGRWMRLVRWPDRRLTACQWDALGSLVHPTEPNRAPAQLVCQTDADAGVGVACAPGWRRGVAVVVGTRDKRMPIGCGNRCRRALMPRPRAFPGINWPNPVRRGCRSRAKGGHRRGMRIGDARRLGAECPGLIGYMRRWSTTARGQVVTVRPNVICGAVASITARLSPAPPRAQGNPGFGERAKLPRRRHDRRLTRTPTGLSTAGGWGEQPWRLALGSYHWGVPHDRRRARLEVAPPPRGSGSPRRWQRIPPAMAAGRTDPSWSTPEGLGDRVPAACLDTIPQVEHGFPSFERVPQGS